MIASLLVLALAVPQSASTPAPAVSPAVKEKPVCRREIPIGSIMPTRTCHSKAEWAMIDRANADSAETARRSNASRGGMPAN